MEVVMNLSRWLAPRVTAHAHCDIPCGIYDPSAAKVAAETVAKMVEMIDGFGKEIPAARGTAKDTARNNFIRSVQVKEEHAQICKRELLILWSDYFTPEHLEKYPNLHDTFWKAAKLCGKNKQSVDAKAAADLQAAVKEISDIFWATKK
jgi:nickel superoxide dismutase